MSIYMCRGADPESKGKIENTVKYIKGNFLSNRLYVDDGILNGCCLDWLGRTANAKIHGTTKLVPAEVFKEEREYLRPLAEFDNAVHPVVCRTVRKYNTIIYNSNRYSVPLGTYNANPEVQIETADGILYIKTLFGDPVCEHLITSGRGLLIQSQSHRRDRKAALDKLQEVSPEDDPAGIPRSDFEQDGYHYTLIDLLKQEMPVNESRQHTETVSVESKSKDMATILSLLPQQREFITDDGLSGTLTLKLDTVNVEVSGYGSSTKTLNTTRSYPGLSSQDTSAIPKSIEDGRHTLTLQSIDWQRSGDVGEDGSERFTAVATYSGSATSSYVTGYTVTADYSGTVSRINLNKTRYVAIFEGVSITTEDAEETEPPVVTIDPAVEEKESKSNVLPVVIFVVVIGAGVGGFLFLKKRRG